MARGRADTWTSDELAAVKAEFEAGVPEVTLSERYGKTRGQIRGKAIRFQWHRPATGRAKELKPWTPAVVEGRTVFTSRVRDPRDAPDLLPSGRWQRKLGKVVTKGEWAGYPIFSLTLEERATCPRSCHHWLTCMGNTMQWSARMRAGPALEYELGRALCDLQHRHPNGFVVRLHVLGDFYSVRYVNRWEFWLQCFPALHVFGYTARQPGTPIGDAVMALARRSWARFAIRLSSEEAGPGRTITLWADDEFAGLDTDEHVILCPAQEGQTEGCGTCGLCWSPAAYDATIAFTAHGVK